MGQKVYTFCFNFLPRGVHLLPHKFITYNLLDGDGNIIDEFGKQFIYKCEEELVNDNLMGQKV